MMPNQARWIRLRFPAFALLLGLVLLAWHPAAARNLSLRAVLVGGGPEPQHNQVAIERNVYYVSHLLPAGAPRWILFASGDPAARNVLYEEARPAAATGERLFELAFGPRGEAGASGERYRAPKLGKLD